jgi:glycosyl transferase family 25
LALLRSYENGQMHHPLLEYFARIEIINLPDRRDRRHEMLSQLKQIGLSPLPGRVEFFSARRPTTRGDWPSVGARGCFLSHYEILRRARDEGLRNILIFEDDCDFAPNFPNQQCRLTQTLSETTWDMLYLGHREHMDSNGAISLLAWSRPLMTAHAYAVNGVALHRLVRHLENVMHRPSGHPEGGRQHFDGALSTFRAQNGDIKTVIVGPSVCTQRSSRSDIYQNRWFDRAWGIRSMAGKLRSIRRTLR